VIERAAILASGADLEAVMSWIAAHAGQPEKTASAKSNRAASTPRASQVHTSRAATCCPLRRSTELTRPVRGRQEPATIEPQTAGGARANPAGQPVSSAGETAPTGAT
jgi:hypothetical protein